MLCTICQVPLSSKPNPNHRHHHPPEHSPVLPQVLPQGLPRKRPLLQELSAAAGEIEKSRNPTHIKSDGILSDFI